MKNTIALPLVLAAVTLAGCASTPPARTTRVYEPPPTPRVYFYPVNGQSEAQQDRDRYDCHQWAVKQTGFDPSRHGVPAERVVVSRGPSEGQGAAVGAVAGAILGAAVAGRGDAGKGAIIGGVAGAMVGSTAANAQAAEAERMEELRARRGGGARYEREATGFRRAMSACLEGRGYSVK